MNKAQLVEAVAQHADTSKAEAERAINALIEVIKMEVKGGTKVSLAGLGTFEKIVRSARTGVNPATGAKIAIKAKNAPKFKAAKAFKDYVL